MYLKLPKSESNARIEKLFDRLNSSGQKWDTALILSRLNQYYFTGTMQDAVLVLKSSGDLHLFVRRSYERAVCESTLENIHQMKSYKDMLSVLNADLGVTYIESEQVPLAMLERIKKYFSMEKLLGLDNTLLSLRSVKSSYELSFMEEAGKNHDKVLTKIVPKLLHEGITEAEMFGEIYLAMVKLGHQGVTRFNGFGIEMQIGQGGFGTSSLYPTNFDGPGGMLGMSAITPSIGSEGRKLSKGDLIFVDIGFGRMGYHTDKTQIYSFNEALSEKALRLHDECIKIQKSIVELLRPGNVPSKIYEEIMKSVSKEVLENHFMGYKGQKVSFLGHGIGLVINECPVIAKGFDEPLVKNMTFAIEPKCGVEGVGIVGVEDTYVVTENGGRCLTGGPSEVIIV